VIPYFEVETLPLGPLTLQPYGLCVLSGWLLATTAGLLLARGRAARLLVVALVLGVGLPVLGVGNLVLQGMGVPWPGSWVVAPLLLGMGALLAWLFDAPSLGAQLEALVFGGLMGCVLYGLGSFLIHDQPGAVTAFPLGVQGICRGGGEACHDLGLYQMLGSLGLAALVLAGGPRSGAAVGLIGYGLLHMSLVALGSPQSSLCFGSMFVLLGLLAGMTALIATGTRPPAETRSAARS
jgi:hypothetical protein